MGEQSKLTFGSLLAVVIVIGFVVSQCKSDDVASSSSVSTTSASARPDPLKTIPGDGVYSQKYWGTWEAGPVPAQCNWSILLRRPYEPAITLDRGSANPGASVRVNWQPADGGDVMLQTHGCGSWQLVD